MLHHPEICITRKLEDREENLTGLLYYLDKRKLELDIVKNKSGQELELERERTREGPPKAKVLVSLGGLMYI